MSETQTSIIAIKPPQELSNETSGVVAWAKSLSIRSQSDYDGAVSHLKVIKTLARRAVDFFQPMKQRADDSKRAILDAERQITGPLAEAERLAKNAILSFTQEQERIRQAEQRLLQAIADEEARKERARLEAAAEKLKTKEKRAARLIEAAHVAAPIVSVAPIITRAANTTTRTVWKARIVDAAAVPRCWLVVNEKALDAFAKSTKGQTPVAGVEFCSEEILAIVR